MCTRYFMDDASAELTEIALAAKKSVLAEKFIRQFSRPIVTAGEVRPTDIAPVIAPNQKGQRTIFPMRWGFTNQTHKSTVFNARCETAASKPTFREAWATHRCIIPASYYFEWQHFKSADGKTATGEKYAIQPAGADITWLCGLYRMEEGLPVFVVLTKEPSAELAEIHDRMPLMLPKDKIDEWISPVADPKGLLEYALGDMVAEKV
ncbi:Putative SOS response-associated peptidase YedK [Lachnospiraceae bacterium XBB1006]|nr:Putative SOS response-associated peptidase YedK [Lachnospiraceae bacterium XBB1006]